MFYHGARRNRSSAIMVFKSLNIPTSNSEPLCPPSQGVHAVSAVLLSGLGRRQIEGNESEPQHRVTGWIPAGARGARLDSCQLTSTSDSPPGQLHVGGPARASARTCAGRAVLPLTRRVAPVCGAGPPSPLPPPLVTFPRLINPQLGRAQTSASLGPVFPNPRSGLGVRASPGRPRRARGL